MTRLRTMTTRLRKHPRSLVAAILVVVLVAGAFVAVRVTDRIASVTVVAYFDNSTGVFAGDDVRIRGVPVGRVVKIEPQPQRAKVTLSFDRKYKVPADAKAVILSPQLVASRAIQLIPPYNGGPTMGEGAVIPQERTAVPVEWDDLRAQLERLTQLLRPTQPGGVSTLGALINTAADNLRGQGGTIRDTLIKLSQAVATLGDHSNDIFSTFKHLSTLVSALHDSTGLLEQLNRNLAATSALLADDPTKVGQAVQDLDSVLADVQSFAADNSEALGTASDRLASITKAVVESLDDIKQLLHLAPTGLIDVANLGVPSTGGLAGMLAIPNFANLIASLCGAVQAASRLGNEQAAKLCVQYLAPIIKNRQYNFLPLGENLFVGARARPNEVTYSEDWLRPDYVPPAAEPPRAPAPAAGPAPQAAVPGAPLPAEAPTSAGGAVATDPAAGLPGMMLPAGGGS